MAADGFMDRDITAKFHTRPNTVGFWRKKFLGMGLDGLRDSARPGKPPLRDPKELTALILKILEDPLPQGQATWDWRALVAKLNISRDKLGRYSEIKASDRDANGAGASARILAIRSRINDRALKKTLAARTF
jgi:hypothetical protein